MEKARELGVASSVPIIWNCLCGSFASKVLKHFTNEVFVRLLAEGGVNFNVVFNFDFTPLIRARESVACTRIILDSGGLVLLGRYSALRTACMARKADVVELILQRRGLLRVIRRRCPITNTNAYDKCGDDFPEGKALLDKALPLAQVNTSSLHTSHSTLLTHQVWDKRSLWTRIGLSASDARNQKAKKTKNSLKKVRFEPLE